MDVAQFGNTEIPLKELNTTVDQLKQRSNDSRDTCKLEIEFEVNQFESCREKFRKKLHNYIFMNRKSKQFRMKRTNHARSVPVRKIVIKIAVIVLFRMIEIESF